MERIVPKVWGEEHWIVNRDEYCGKKLILKKGLRCSLHMHPIKDETFHLESGAVLLELSGEKHRMKPGDTIHIPTGEWHRFSGIEESVILEFSTRHRDEDVQRREDSGPIPPDVLSELQSD